MEDVTDPSFRLMCRGFGADLVYTEFVSADALVRNVKKTQQKLMVSDAERPVVIQIYGKDVAAMRDAALMAEEAKPDIIDINFGCPVRKIAGKGAGAGLLRDIPRMLEITQSVVDAVALPVTVKTRLGWDDSSKPIVGLAEQLQDAGAKALAIHGRTREQMYKGTSDWSLIGEVKRNPRMHIPIIGNGDISNGEEAKKAFETYGVDAIMIGRACIGAPWIFKEVRDYLDGKEVYLLSYKEKLDVLKKQIQNNVAWLEEKRGILHSRRHIAVSPLFKGLKDFRAMRVALLRANTQQEVFELLDEVLFKYGSDPANLM